jgi:hypothetical protein
LKKKKKKKKKKKSSRKKGAWQPVGCARDEAFALHEV